MGSELLLHLLIDKKTMFKKAFSFRGRIGRLEYAISFCSMFFLFLYYAIITTSLSMLASEDLAALMIYLPIIIWFWFMAAQGVKRSHDIGNNGWWMLIPFYYAVLLFIKGDVGSNTYGRDPNNTDEEEDRGILDSEFID